MDFTEGTTMKLLRKLTPLLLSAAMTVSLTACSGSTSQSAPNTDAAPVDDGLYTIGICQLVQHAAHDDATQGFKDALNEVLPNQVTFTSHIASNDIAACSGIVNQFIAEEVDLILANATPALQIASAATGEIPILGTSVTAYGAAMGLDDFTGVVGGNVSGTSDLAPLDAQAAMIQEWFPDAETIGMLYCSAEVNSDYQITEVSKLLEEMGYTCKDFAFTESNDLPLVLEAAIANCDVLFVPTDNTVASNSTIIDNYCRPAGIPILGGDQGICNGCTAATLCVSYYDLGYQTGLMAAKVLTGEADISTMPIEFGSTTSVYNEAICADLSLTPPSAKYVPVSVD